MRVEVQGEEARGFALEPPARLQQDADGGLRRVRVRGVARGVGERVELQLRVRVGAVAVAENSLVSEAREKRKRGKPRQARGRRPAVMSMMDFAAAARKRACRVPNSARTEEEPGLEVLDFPVWRLIWGLQSKSERGIDEAKGESYPSPPRASADRRLEPSAKRCPAKAQNTLGAVNSSCSAGTQGGSSSRLGVRHARLRLERGHEAVCELQGPSCEHLIPCGRSVAKVEACDM